MQRQFDLIFNRILYERRLELKYLALGGVCASLLLALSASPLFGLVEDDLISVMEAALGMGLAGLFAIALISNLAIIVNIPFMLVALPWVVANPTPEGVLLFSVITGSGAALGKLIAYALALRVTARFATLDDSPLPRWMTAQIERHPRFAPVLVFLAASTILPLDPALMPLILVGYPACRVAVPLALGKITHSLTLALVIVMSSSSLGMGGGLNVDLTLGVVLVTLLLVAYQVEKAQR